LYRKCLLEHVIEGKLEGSRETTGRRGRRRKKLQAYLQERRRYWKLKAEVLTTLSGELALEGEVMVLS
jgi:hypothetical protein